MDNRFEAAESLYSHQPHAWRRSDADDYNPDFLASADHPAGSFHNASRIATMPEDPSKLLTSMRMGRTSGLPRPALGQLEPAIADSKWIQSEPSRRGAYKQAGLFYDEHAARQQNSIGFLDPFPSPTRQGHAGILPYPGSELGPPAESGSDSEGDSSPRLQQPQGLLKRRPLHADLGTHPTPMLPNHFHRVGTHCHEASKWEQQSTWPGFSSSTTGMHALDQSCFRISPSQARPGGSIEESAQEDGSVSLSPSPLRPHPWACAMESKRQRTHPRPQHKLVHTQLTLPKSDQQSSVLQGRQPPHEDTSTGIPSWLEGSSAFDLPAHQYTAASASDRSPSDQLSLRHADEQEADAKGGLGRPDPQDWALPEEAAQAGAARGDMPLHHAQQSPQGPQDQLRSPSNLRGGPISHPDMEAEGAPDNGPSDHGHQPESPSSGSAGDDQEGPQDFHSLAHMRRFARLAERTVAQVASQLPRQTSPPGGLQDSRVLRDDPDVQTQSRRLKQSLGGLHGRLPLHAPGRHCDQEGPAAQEAQPEVVNEDCDPLLPRSARAVGGKAAYAGHPGPNQGRMGVQAQPGSRVPTRRQDFAVPRGSEQDRLQRPARALRGRGALGMKARRGEAPAAFDKFACGGQGKH